MIYLYLNTFKCIYYHQMPIYKCNLVGPMRCDLQIEHRLGSTVIQFLWHYQKTGFALQSKFSQPSPMSSFWGSRSFFSQQMMHKTLNSLWCCITIKTNDLMLSQNKGWQILSLLFRKFVRNKSSFRKSRLTSRKQRYWSVNQIYYFN